MAIKVKVKQRGAYLTVNGESQEIEVGKVLEFDGDALPGFLVGKAEIIGDTDGKELVVADELLAAASEENKVLSAKVDALTADLEKATADLAAAENQAYQAAVLIRELTEKNSALETEIADLKKSGKGR